MKIQHTDKSTIYFATLYPGDTFSFSGDTYMKVEAFQGYTAVNLRIGTLLKFVSDTAVVPLPEGTFVYAL